MSLRTKLLVTGIFLCVALGATIFFAVQTFQAIQHFQEEHALTLAGDVSTIRPWMTIPYISRVYRVPESYLYEWLHITDPRSVSHTSLRALAGRYNLPVAGLISDVQNAIKTYRNQHPHDSTASLYIDTLLVLREEKIMSALLSDLLTFFETYGYVALWVCVFIAAAGAPLPIYVVLLAAGAFAALGDFNSVLLFVIAFSAQVCGDNVGYLIGRRWGSKVLNWLEQSKKWNRFIPSRTIERSRHYFRHRGGWAIFLSRFLFTALGGIINLLAGSELYPYRYFILAEASGKVLGVLIPLLLGFIFAASWEVMGDILGPLSLFILGLLAVFLLVRLLIKYMRELKQAHSAVVSQSRQSLDVQSIPGGAPVVDTPASPSGKLPLL